MIRPTRRRLLTIMGAAAGMTLSPSIGRTATVPRWRWRGNALGAKAEMTLVHPDEAIAKRLIRLAVDEIERLEDIFSLYHPDSEIVRLNRHGRIETPSPDLVTLLSTARQISGLTDGAFDVTVQPLWRLYAEHFSGAVADSNGPPAATIEAAKNLVDYRAIDVTPSHIRITRPGMAITLNGIAQGYITDRIVDLLRAHGIQQTLINLGEIFALGNRPDGRPWQIAIEGAARRQPIDLIDRAIATSSPTGTVFDEAGQCHHLFDPATGRPSAEAKSMSVIANRATVADALSTALAVKSKVKLTTIKARFPNIDIIEAG